MKYFILAIALMATVGCATKIVEVPAETPRFLGFNQHGQALFFYQGLKHRCALSDPETVICQSQAGDWNECDFLSEEDGYFENCRPTDDPNLTPT